MSNQAMPNAGAANADAAPNGSPTSKDRDVNAPHATRCDTLDGGQKPDQLDGKEAENRQEALVDEGVEETFPASDPVSVKRIT